MAKELPSSVVVFKQGFEDGELEELYERSNEHREELKAKLGERHLLSRIVRGSGESPRDLHKRMCSSALCYYIIVWIKTKCARLISSYWSGTSY
eukprot:751031-Hanusia_phi.AAC.3